jgi:hypothetical protein
VTSTTHSLYLEAGQFRDLTERTSDRPWLLVLNCCESAAAGPKDNLQSLALMLVRDAALPAVVGMREPVSSTDASTFTKAFYTALLAEVDGRRAGTVAADEPLNWARYAVCARTTLLDQHQMPRTEAAESTREWTLPVVYLRPDPFVVTVPAAPVPVAPVLVPPEPVPVPPPAAPTPIPPPGGPPRAAGAPHAHGGAPTDAPPTDAAPADAAPDDEAAHDEAADDEAADDEAARSARLEADLLRGLLTRLPPDSPPDLIADIQARLAVLGAPVPVVVPEPVPLAPA